VRKVCELHRAHAFTLLLQQPVGSDDQRTRACADRQGMGRRPESGLLRFLGRAIAGPQLRGDGSERILRVGRADTAECFRQSGQRGESRRELLLRSREVLMKTWIAPLVTMMLALCASTGSAENTMRTS